MFNIGVSLINRFGTLLALKALPDEAALQHYMRRVFKGVFFLILGSVLTGAIIVTLLYIAYDQILSFGYPKTNALIITITTMILLTAMFFCLANKCLANRSKRRPEGIIDEKLDQIRDIASDSINGFIEGLLNEHKCKSKKRRN